WKVEYERLMNELGTLTAGVDGDTGSWKSQQDLLAIRQTKSESTGSFLDRLETTVAGLSSHGVALDSGRLIAALLSSLRQDVEEVAVDRLTNAGGRLTNAGLILNWLALWLCESVNQVVESSERNGSGNKVCYSWRRSRKCRFGRNCRFAHSEPDGGRSSNAILGVRSMCDCGVTLSFGTTGDNERSVKVKATVGDPASSVQEYIDEGVNGLYQISDENDDHEAVLNSVVDTPGIVISGGVLSHPSKCGSNYMETNGWLPVMGAGNY
ncbi:hypothetical protein FOL47_002120, partial [Perkinsus chesapeaki]